MPDSNTIEIEALKKRADDMFNMYKEQLQGFIKKGNLVSFEAMFEAMKDSKSWSLLGVETFFSSIPGCQELAKYIDSLYKEFEAIEWLEDNKPQEEPK